MLLITDGVIANKLVTNKIQPRIEKGLMSAVHGIIVHQTGGSTAASAFASYEKGVNGAHLLIETDGVIYQTAHLNQITWHIGALKARCVVEMNCKPSKKWDPSGTNKQEQKKVWPNRYPSNSDAIGIELVGAFDVKANKYATVTENQNASLKWLVGELQTSLALLVTEVFRHPDVSYKDPTEAKSAKW